MLNLEINSSSIHWQKTETELQIECRAPLKKKNLPMNCLFAQQEQKQFIAEFLIKPGKKDFKTTTYTYTT